MNGKCGHSFRIPLFSYLNCWYTRIFRRLSMVTIAIKHLFRFKTRCTLLMCSGNIVCGHTMNNAERASSVFYLKFLFNNSFGQTTQQQTNSISRWLRFPFTLPTKLYAKLEIDNYFSFKPIHCCNAKFNFSLDHNKIE